MCTLLSLWEITPSIEPVDPCHSVCHTQPLSPPSLTYYISSSRHPSCLPSPSLNISDGDIFTMFTSINKASRFLFLSPDSNCVFKLGRRGITSFKGDFQPCGELTEKEQIKSSQADCCARPDPSHGHADIHTHGQTG